jgi:ergothioneine biosynthesis protein EgtB
MLETLLTQFVNCRNSTIALSAPLSEADMQIQADVFASPGKWHLAHTSWFFNEFILKRFNQQPTGFDGFDFLFNSYYESVGKRQPQNKRGLITRPSLVEILDYRQVIDKSMVSLLKTDLADDVLALIELGIHHEQQHQELFLTDILYNLSHNPLNPAYQKSDAKPFETLLPELTMQAFEGGLISIGHQNDDSFHYDNEQPNHRVFLEPFSLANRLVTNAEWINFIEAGGYDNALLWLSDGWHIKQNSGWEMPLYWEKCENAYQNFSLNGLQAVDLNAPVRHISYFEADAFARWRSKRLPTEAEWEYALTSDNHGLLQVYGELWQWTASPYTAYPGFKASAGAVGEYNGKFMNGQYVLRGSSFATAPNHSRASYRNFFAPHHRWQFSGLRLAE